MFHGEGRIWVAVRTVERHGVSEKVGKRKASMPNPESSDGNFVATKGRLEKDEGRG